MKIFLDDQFDSERESWIPEGYVGARNFAEFEKPEIFWNRVYKKLYILSENNFQTSEKLAP